MQISPNMIAGLLLLFSGSLFFLKWISLFVSNYTGNEFDIALRLISHAYASQGLLPYKDFGVVYPPGLFALMGILFPTSTLVVRNAIFALIYLVIMWGIALQYQALIGSKKNSNLPLTLFLFIVTILTSWSYGREIFSVPLILLVIATSVASLAKKTMPRFPHWIIFFSAAASVWFRWDWMLFLVMIFCFIFGLLYVAKSLSSTYTKLFSSLVGGYLFGTLLLVLFLITHGIFHDGYRFVVEIPTVVIREYRSLPFPHFQHPGDISASFAVSIATFVGFSLMIARRFHTKTKNPQESVIFVILLLAPFTFLPYALGRADWEHAIPFLVSLGICIGLYAAHTRTYVLPFLLTCLLAVPTAYHLWQIQPLDKNIMIGRLETDIREHLAECAEVTKNTQPNSVFVGRTSYDRFIINVASLYLLFPHVQPATRYISDEPGLQNTCAVGQEIVQDLVSAPKPMLTFLATQPEGPEPNKTTTMQSCGTIESYIHTRKYEPIGACTAYGRMYDIRLYIE